MDDKSDGSHENIQKATDLLAVESDSSDRIESIASAKNKLFHIGSPPKEPILSHRFIRTQEQLEERYSRPVEQHPSYLARIRRLFFCPKDRFGQYFINLFPIVSVFRTYKLSFILHDLVGGITTGCLSFPLGIAFGVLASLNPAYGLYSSFYPVLLYMTFGTSRHISFGTNGIISLFTSELIHSHLPAGSPNATQQEDDVELKSAIASGSTCIIGIILLLMGLFRLGFIVSYISSSFVSGFTTAGGVYIVTSMLPGAFGIKIPRYIGPGRLILTYIAIFQRIPEMHVASLVSSVLTAAVLLLIKDVINVKFKDKLRTPIPADFIVIILATIISYFTNLTDSFNVNVVGDIPAGMPPPKMPYLSFDLVVDSLVIVVMILVLSVSMSRLCEAAHNYRIDDNQELVAYGMTNFVSAFFLCFPSCAGPARTITLCLMGPKSTLHGVVSSLFILLILLFVGPLFRSLPVPVLSVMVIIAVKNLVLQMKELPEIWRVNRYDFLIAVGTNMCGCFIDFPYALYVGLVLCMFTIVLQSQNPKAYLLSKLSSEDRFLSEKHYKGLIRHPNIKIFKFEASLYFATAEIFRKKLYQLTDERLNLSVNLRKRMESYIVSRDQSKTRSLDCLRKDSIKSYTRLPWDGLHDKTLHNKNFVILDCSSINYIDINGLRILIQVICEMENDGITIVFASCNQYVRNFFRKIQLASKISNEHIFADISDAYNALIA